MECLLYFFFNTASLLARHLVNMNIVGSILNRPVYIFF